jgi:hypothetical protein
MPEPEQNKKWDALLRAYAKKPRPEIELHPVSRRVLQDEVKKTFGTGGGAAKKAGLFSRWWFRWPLAAAFGACAILLIVQNRRFEEQQSLDRRVMPMSAANAPPPTAAPQATELASPAVVTAGTIAGRLDAPSNLLTRNKAAFGASARFTAQGGAVDKLFVSNGRQLFQNGPPAQKVLNSFQVERTGDRVQVTDGDGSVYTGQVVALRVEAATSYSFAVHGVNNSIQQPVDFNGRFDSNQTQLQRDNGAVSNAQNLSQTVRVSGTATVGATNQFPVDAIPVP